MTIIIFQKLVFDACWWRCITLKQQTCWLIWQRVKVRFCTRPNWSVKSCKKKKFISVPLQVGIFMGITWNRNVLKQHLPVLYKLFAAWHLHYTVRVHPVGLSRYMFTKFQALLWSLVLSGQVLRYFTKRRAKEESILWSSCVTMTVKHNRNIHETSINTKNSDMLAFWNMQKDACILFTLFKSLC